MKRWKKAMLAAWAGGQTYTQRVRALGPIAYWPLNEPAGTTGAGSVLDASGNGRTGTPSAGVTFGQTGIGDGNTAASFSAAYVDVSSLATPFDGTKGTVAAWVKVSGAGVWTDGAFRRWLSFISNSNSNGVQFRKENTNNTLYFEYRAGTTNSAVSLVGTQSSTGWLHMALTWDKAADQVKAYLNGAQVGTTQTGLGVYGGTLAATTTCIGALNTSAGQPTSGLIAHVVVLNYAATPAQIATIGVL